MITTEFLEATDWAAIIARREDVHAEYVRVTNGVRPIVFLEAVPYHLVIATDALMVAFLGVINREQAFETNLNGVPVAGLHVASIFLPEILSQLKRLSFGVAVVDDQGTSQMHVYRPGGFPSVTFTPS